jgi:phospholipase C
LNIFDRYSDRTTSVTLRPGDQKSHRRSLLEAFGWYDVVITVADDASLEFRYAGHVENGRSRMSDPAMGGLIRRP